MMTAWVVVVVIVDNNNVMVDDNDTMVGLADIDLNIDDKRKRRQSD